MSKLRTSPLEPPPLRPPEYDASLGAVGCGGSWAEITVGIAVMVPGGEELSTNASPSSPRVKPAAFACDLATLKPLEESRNPPAVSAGTRLMMPYGVAELNAA